MKDIYGTEDDKVNCPFYFKMGACRHGDKCTRVHNKPQISETILIKNMFKDLPISIAIQEGQDVSKQALKEVVKHFEDFYKNAFFEFITFGKVEEFHVLDNLGDHMAGNVYIKYSHEDEAKAAHDSFQGKYFGKELVKCEFSPVNDFRESRCRQYDKGTCNYGGYCNFMHMKYVSKTLLNQLYDQMYEEYPHYTNKKRDKPPGYGNLVDLRSYERQEVFSKWNEVQDKKFKIEKEDFNIAQDKINDFLKKFKYLKN